MPRYDCRTDKGAVYTIDAADPIGACVRVADLHQVTVVAVRPSREPTIHVGIPEGC